MKYIYIFSVIGLFILFIATINYINLTSAQFGRRSIEMGLRRAAGANRIQLIIQLIGESLIVSYIALFAALILAEIILPFFNSWFTRDLHIGYWEQPSSLMNIILIATLLGIVAGIYPGWLFTYRNPATTIRSEKLLSKIRRATIVSQFTISMLFIASNIVVFKQVNFIKNIPLGLSTDHIIKLPINQSLVRQFDSYRTELKTNSNILNVTAGQAVPFNEDIKTDGVDWPGKEPDFAPVFRYSITLNDYIETFDIEVIEGRSFSQDFVSDVNNYLINETALKYMNLEDPVGEEITFWGQKGTIIGVVKDFHHVSLHKEILPQIITIHPRNYQALQHVFIKISDMNISSTIAFVESTTKKFSPDFPFDYSFIDESIDDLYTTENRLAKAISLFSIIALCISALGIFGMTAFSVEKRMKEITMRKICGASNLNILLILNKEILRWVGIAILVGGPIAFVFALIWLRDFAYKTSVPWWIFLASAMFILILSMVASASESMKAARKSPVESLKYE
jgi:ABC-type antimicrobial peptide transport system permease subunit